MNNKIRNTIVSALGGTLLIAGIGACSTTVEEKPAKPAQSAEKQSPNDVYEKEMREAEKHNAEGRAEFSADTLKGYATSNGTPAEQAAAEHITKVQDDAAQDAFMPMADIYTDLPGGILSSDVNDAQLIVSLYKGLAEEQGFTTSDNSGLVTVYNAKGEMLMNGNF